MGQHFLADAGAAEQIVKRAQLKSDSLVLEIGAGLGALTLLVAPQVKHILAVEPDRHIAAILANELEASEIGNVTIIEEDILQCDLAEMAERYGTSLKVLGNLPYHISSQVLIRLIRFRPVIDTAFLMFQKEVAERLVAGPGTKRYGRLSVLIQYCADVKPLFSLAASAFFPKPKVDSQVLCIAFLHPVPFQASNEPLLFQVVGAAFGKRRKTLKNALSRSNLGIGEERVLAALQLAAIDPQRRAETLSVEEFVALSNACASLG
jgi:16S rRNA (adenine1518-N6/adenine1519-N6)-dimethyltransferase